MTGNDQTATGKRSPWIWFSAIGLILVSLLICEIKSFHIVRPEKIGVRMRLGQPVDIVEPGLHYFQWPLETVETVNFGVDRIAIDLTMLPSSDRHLMDASFFVMWSIVDPISYVASKRDAVAEIRDNFERELRDELSRRPANDLYREKRPEISAILKAAVQKAADKLHLGVRIEFVSIENAKPHS